MVAIARHRKSGEGANDAPPAGRSPSRRKRGSNSKSRVTTGPASSGFAGREQMIAEAAYYQAERRGFEPGHELGDWLAAELEVESLVAGPRESIDEADVIAPIP